jgi:pSer/pThr/pTyr-binding forkhead associated (FHA) protein
VLDPIAKHSLTPSELQALLHAERDGEPFFAFRDAEDRLALFRAGRAGTHTLGRRAEMDLTIDWDDEVSGLHAELVAIGGEWTVVDDGLSTNGTFVNARRVAGRQRLRDGDRVRVGKTVLVYRAGRDTPVARTVSAGDAPPPVDLTATQRKVLIALCRPYRDGGSFTSPATNQQIAGEVFLSVEAVKMHLRTLFGKFELGELPQNEKRTRLAECALEFGVISRQEL